MLEDLFNKDICTCNHSISQDHLLNTCYALDFNGAIYAACDCRQVKVKAFSIRISQDELIPTDKDSITGGVVANQRAVWGEVAARPPL